MLHHSQGYIHGILSMLFGKKSVFALLIICISMSGAKGMEGFSGQGVFAPLDTVYSYVDMRSDLCELAARYCDIVSVETIGSSVLGRDIYALVLGRGEHRVLVGASFHAREYITTNYVMRFVEEYASAYAEDSIVDGVDARQMLDNVSFCIIPMINPDGVEIVQKGYDGIGDVDIVAKVVAGSRDITHKSWKANARGVDINRNFDYGWGRKHEAGFPSPSGYAGPYAISEPETLAIATYAKRVSPEAVVAFHTQGQVLYLSTPDTIAERMADRVCEHTGFSIEPIEEPYGSFQDYVDHYFNVFYACVELCPYIGPYPYPENEFEQVWESAKFVLPIVAEELSGIALGIELGEDQAN